MQLCFLILLNFFKACSKNIMLPNVIHVSIRLIFLHLWCCYHQVITGHDCVMDDAGNKLPWLVYVSREKRPGYDHHKKAGALNALVIL